MCVCVWLKRYQNRNPVRHGQPTQYFTKKLYSARDQSIFTLLFAQASNCYATLAVFSLLLGIRIAQIASRRGMT